MKEKEGTFKSYLRGEVKARVSRRGREARAARGRRVRKKAERGESILIRHPCFATFISVVL